MFIIHSLKNIVRSWPKSLLFLVLLAALGMTLCIGVSLTTAIMGFLKECDENYTTIAVFEFIGVDYPDESIYDPGIARCMEDFDFSALAEDPDVLCWDETAVALGSIAGKTVNAAHPPYKDAAVAVIYILSYDENKSAYQYSVIHDLMDPEAQPRSGFIRTDHIDLEIRHTYLVNWDNGELSPYVNASAALAGVDCSVENMITEITSDDDGFSLPPDSVLRNIVDTYLAVNSGVTVYATNDAEALLPFNQAQLFVAKGRSFTEDEYSSGAAVCMLSERLAGLCGVDVGDSIGLSLAVQAGVVQKESYWAGTGFKYNDIYTVVGILNPNDDFRDTVFIPKSQKADLSDNRYTYTIGQARVRNDGADDFYARMLEVLPPRVRMTVYDQGYSAAAAPMRDVLRIAIVISIACAVTTLAVLALYGFLFVYRQRVLAKLMRRVGASNGGIIVYFLSGSSCLALLSASAGAFISRRLSGTVMDFVREAAASYGADDLRYSVSALSVARPMEFAPDVSPVVFAVTAAAVFVAAVAACFVYTYLSIKSQTQIRRPASKKQTARPATEKKARRTGTVSRSLSGGSLKYAWLSVIRGASRSILPIVLCAFSAALLLQLTHTTVAYKTSYDDMSRDTEISGYFTDVRGIWRNRLLLGGPLIRDMYQSDCLSKISLSKSFFYGYNIPYTQEIPKYPVQNLGSRDPWEAFIQKITSGPNFIYTNDIAGTQEFYGCTELPVTFIDGFSAERFAQMPLKEEPIDTSFLYEKMIWPNREPYPAIVSEDFLKNNNLAPGDDIYVYTNNGSDLICDTKYIKIVGSFVRQGRADNIYVPLYTYHSAQISIYSIRGERMVRYTDTPISYIFSGQPDDVLLRGISVSSLGFTVRGAQNLSMLKEILYERGYSEVNTIRAVRSFVTIDDKVFLATQRAMSQRLWYMERIFPVLYTLVEILAVLTSFILIQLRKREAALMRSQGAGKATAILSVFWEQVILCLPGVIIGAGTWVLASGSATVSGVRLTALFALLWLASAGVSAFALNRGSVRVILKAEE